MTLTAYAEPRFAPLPPSSYRPPSTDWQAIVDQLAANPGEWAAIAVISASQSIGARGVKLRRKGVQTTQRSNGDGTATIWACYVGIPPAACTVPPLEVPADAIAAWFPPAPPPS